MHQISIGQFWDSPLTPYTDHSKCPMLHPDPKTEKIWHKMYTAADVGELTLNLNLDFVNSTRNCLYMCLFLFCWISLCILSVHGVIGIPLRQSLSQYSHTVLYPCVYHSLCLNHCHTYFKLILITLEASQNVNTSCSYACDCEIILADWIWKPVPGFINI